MIGYVLISLDKPNEEEMINHLTDLDEVKEAHILFGEWDIAHVVLKQSTLTPTGPIYTNLTYD